MVTPSYLTSRVALCEPDTLLSSWHEGFDKIEEKVNSSLCTGGPVIYWVKYSVHVLKFALQSGEGEKRAKNTEPLTQELP